MATPSATRSLTAVMSPHRINQLRSRATRAYGLQQQQQQLSTALHTSATTRHSIQLTPARRHSNILTTQRRAFTNSRTHTSHAASSPSYTPLIHGMIIAVIGGAIYTFIPATQDNSNTAHCDDTLSSADTIKYDTTDTTPHYVEPAQPTEQPGLMSRIWHKIYDYLPSFVKADNTPALPPAQPDVYGRQPRTLVIGWNTVLVATQWTRQHGWRMQARNDAAHFLRKAFENGYEIVLWCDQPQHDVEQHTMSPYIGGDIIRHRLYYDNMSMKQFKTVKDLTKLDRDLKRVIVIDSSSKFYWLQPDNAVVIEPFLGDPADRQLSALIPVLEKIQKYNVHDVRGLIHQYNNDHNANLFAIHEQLAQNAKQALGTYKQSNTDKADSNNKASKQNGIMNKLTALFSSKPQLAGQKLKLDFDDDD